MDASRALYGWARPVVPWVAGVVAAVALLAPAAPATATESPAATPVSGDDDAIDSLDSLRLGGSHAAHAGADRSLVGIFQLDPGECDGPAGTYFQMAQPGGSPDDGPFVGNNDSPCDDSGVTPLRPGSDGGLITGSYQPHPDPAFDGNAGAAGRITEPQAFFGTDFAVATNPTDPQTGTDVPAPEVNVDESGALSGDLSAFAAAWQGQHFNQGSPKPDGSTTGGTTAVTGTYDESSGRFTLEWSSQIEGGPFNNFTGVWHLEGEFRPTENTQQSSPTADPAPTGDTSASDSAATSEEHAGARSATTDPTAPGSLADTGGSGLSALAVVLAVLGLGVAALLRGAGSAPGSGRSEAVADGP